MEKTCERCGSAGWDVTPPSLDSDYDLLCFSCRNKLEAETTKDSNKK